MYELSKDDHDRLVDEISAILREKGLRATTMDEVASRLGMSKRTLYEIFENKTEMICCVIRRHREITRHKIEEFFATSSNVMEALLRNFQWQGEFMTSVNIAYLRDLDTYYTDIKEDIDRERQFIFEKIYYIIKLGIQQGVFRRDVDYKTTLLMFNVQMESLKRMEEFFPKSITLSMAYNTIYTGFLRSIATPKGMKIVDTLISQNLDAARPAD